MSHFWKHVGSFGHQKRSKIVSRALSDILCIPMSCPKGPLRVPKGPLRIPWSPLGIPCGSPGGLRGRSGTYVGSISCTWAPKSDLKLKQITVKASNTFLMGLGYQLGPLGAAKTEHLHETFIKNHILALVEFGKVPASI